MTQQTLPGAQYLPRHGSVLVIRLSALGDVLFALETVAALQRERPDLHVDFLVEDRFASLLEQHPGLRKVWIYPRRQRLRIPGSLLALRKQRYDVVLDLQGNSKSAMHLLFAQATHKVAAAPPAAREGSHRLASLVVPMPDPLPHRADVGHRLLAALGLSGTPAAAQLAAIAPHADLLANLPRPLVILHPGTSAFAAFKRWPSTHFAQLAQGLVAQGCGVAITHGPNEQALLQPMLDFVPQARPIDGSRIGLRGLAGVLRAADAVVAADTGPLHIAAAVGTPCVALFGPKEVARYGPREQSGAQHRVLVHEVPCRPCTRRDCASPQCVLGIAPPTVLAAVRELLQAVR